MNSPLLPEQAQPSPTPGIEHASAAPEFQRDTPPPPGRGPRRRMIARRYRVDEPLAEGGMAVVYRGWHVPLDEPIAIKILKREYAENEEAVTRFLQEARAGALLRGKNVAQVLDIGRLENGLPFMVTELLQGLDLEQLVEKRGRLPIETTIRLLSDVCSAVAEIHRSGIVHRDLKPANIFVAQDGDGQPLIKLLDFGIAKRLDGNDLNDTKNSLGSPHYMAPEQFVSPEAVDVQADIWSLGIVLCELLTGRVPFDADTVPAVCAQALRAPCPAPSSISPDVPAALDHVVLRCLEKDPSARYGSALELRDALLACDAESSVAPGDELNVPITVALPLEEPLPSEPLLETLAGERMVALRRRRGTRVFAVTMAACAAILALSFSPTRDAVERASGATEYAAQRTYQQAAKALGPRWERWFPEPAGQQPTPAPALAPATAPAELQPTVPVVAPAPPEAVATHPAPSPPKPKHPPSKASPPLQLALPQAVYPDLAIERRYALTPSSPKPQGHDLIDPYPER